VKLIFDPKNPAPLTSSKRAELEAIEAMPDDQIVTTDARFPADVLFGHLAANRENIAARNEVDAGQLRRFDSVPALFAYLHAPDDN